MRAYHRSRLQTPYAVYLTRDELDELISDMEYAWATAAGDAPLSMFGRFAARLEKLRDAKPGSQA